MMMEIVETDCPYCGDLFLEINLSSCVICCKFERACAACMEKHSATHSAVEVEAFRREMLGEPPMSERERVNLGLKDQVRRQAETICQLIDNYESLVQKYEHQCRILAEEIDRRTPAS
jgi:hypothetical protein